MRDNIVNNISKPQIDDISTINEINNNDNN